MKKSFLSVALVLFLPSVCFSAGLKCAELPSCEEMGYFIGTDPYCGADDSNYIKCPYDQKYKKCVNYDCAKIGFTQNDKSSWCEDIVYCKHNSEYSLCAAKK